MRSGSDARPPEPVEGSGSCDDAVALVYRQVVSHPGASITAVCTLTALPADAVRGALGRLEELSLVHADDGGDGWVAMSPRTAAAATLGPIDAEIRRRQNDADRLRADLDAMEQVYRDALPQPQGEEVIELLDQAERVRHVLTDAAEQCTVEVLGAHAGGRIEPEMVADALARDVQLLQRGVRMRSLLQHSARACPVTQAYVRALTAAGGEVRTTEVVVGRLVAFDRKMAFLSRSSSGGGATVLRQPDVVEYLCDLFEQNWQNAAPFGDEGLTPDLRDSMRRTLLEMLARGMKDEAIARTLGMSLRTCRRRIAEVMDEVGARSRFEAGVKAAQLRLLDAGLPLEDTEPSSLARTGTGGAG
ncbi:LuxR family transcriptional regulator [Motilibacter aurantiacus]|uniref:LuxR family transcriptional regulator n=1 Tax=Motilibacter aurantiacus TaxID=2714955 RepID=UPI00140D9400|nr:LuxR family transcriptional regulator [Motilibacter aurantiacus]NHC47572.1 LuxR family transcriptional regulator [Motilibacter aurantiacus]